MAEVAKTTAEPAGTFQEMIFRLEQFWADHGCVVLRGYDKEMGAGTFHPATALYALGPYDKWRCAYVQPSRRPTDGRYGENPHRLQRYYQFQVLLKPAPEDSRELYEASLAHLGLDKRRHDFQYAEDDWESPTLGATGLGWEVRCDGLEITQFTYFQQMGGIECNPPSVELTYGLERIASIVQERDSVYDLAWNNEFSYGEVHRQVEIDFSKYNFEQANLEALRHDFDQAEASVKQMLDRFDSAEAEVVEVLRGEAVLAAYDKCLEASHLFNLLDARGAISPQVRQKIILRVRELVTRVCEAWINQAGAQNNG